MTQMLIDRRVKNKLWNSNTIYFHIIENKLHLHVTAWIKLRESKMLSKNYKS